MSNPESFEQTQRYLVRELSSIDREAEQGTPDELLYSREFFDALGNPQESFPSIHISGTSGKGSATFIISALLKEHGFTVGTLISPHVKDLRERSMVNLELTTRETFVETADQLIIAAQELEDRGRGKPRFAEIFVGMGFLVCKKSNVDYAVVETVMGGRFDPTNTVARDDKHAVITNVGLDHEGMLGSSVEEIAWHKAGVIAQDSQASALLPEEPSVRKIMEREAREKRSRLVYTDPALVASNVSISEDGVNFDYKSGDLEIGDVRMPTLASYQVVNASLALDSLQMIAERDGFAVDPEAARNALGTIRIPSRLEVSRIGDRKVIIDGATNPQKLSYLIGALKDANIKPPIWVFGAGRKKDHKELFSAVSSYANGIVFSDYDRIEAPHMQGQSADAQYLAKVWQDDHPDIPCFGATENVNDAFSIASDAASESHIVVSGSVYMIGEFEPDEFAAKEKAEEPINTQSSLQN